MPQTLWLIGLPMGAAVVVYLLRRTWAGAGVAVVAALFLAWLSVQVPPGVVLNLLGRTIELDELSQISLLLLFVATAGLFVVLVFLSLAQRVERHSRTGLGGIGGEGHIFYPAALVILGLLATASLSRHLGITAIFITLAAIIAVFVIQTERLESTRAALRFLILISLSTPLFLLAAWKIDEYQLAGGLANPQDLELIALLVGFGFAIWLAVIPFHSWATSTAAESSPPTAAFVLITFPVVAFSIMLHLFIDLPWLTGSLYLVNAILIAGVVTAFVGGILAAIQRGFSELLGYVALFDIGCTLTVLGIGGRAAIITILVSLTVRMLALILIAASMSTLNILSTSTGFTRVKGIAYQMPVATIGLMVGGLTLAGAPFTAGFAPYWQLIHSMLEIDNRGAVLLVLGGLGAAVSGRVGVTRPPTSPA